MKRDSRYTRPVMLRIPADLYCSLVASATSRGVSLQQHILERLARSARVRLARPRLGRRKNQ